MKYKPALIFLLRFFITYLVLNYAYHRVVSYSGASGKPDVITTRVARHVNALASVVQKQIKVIPDEAKPFYKVMYEDRYVARIIEGCNSFSVILLFWAFIVAFKGEWIKTVLFGIAGSLGIYVFNLFRILLLSVWVARHPGNVEFLHNVVFPAMIYGFTFLLWVVWVRYFADR